MHTQAKIQYLVKQAEEHSQRKEKRDIRPGWLTHFIQETADLFEPDAEAARVGFDCRFDTDQWHVLFYLGEAETFGGMNDGKRSRVAFDFDLKHLLNQFATVDSLRYQALPEDLAEPEAQECTLIEFSGLFIADEKPQKMMVSILSNPPKSAGPGVRILPNGEIELV